MAETSKTEDDVDRSHHFERRNFPAREAQKTQHGFLRIVFYEAIIDVRNHVYAVKYVASRETRRKHHRALDGNEAEEK